jgi:hypothetical protein
MIDHKFNGNLKSYIIVKWTQKRLITLLHRDIVMIGLDNRILIAQIPLSNQHGRKRNITDSSAIFIQ